MIPRGMYRNRGLLNVAHVAPCMLRIDKVCRSGVFPSVPCHSNFQRHGRGKNLKSHDCFVVAGCPPCHHWLDEGPALREEKDAAFMMALERYVLWLFQNNKIEVRQ